VCSEAKFRKNYFSANFPLVLHFQCGAPRRTRSCRMLTWQYPSRPLSDTTGRVPYRLRIAFFSPLRRTTSLCPIFSCLFAILCVVIVISQVFIFFCPYLHIFSIPGILLCLLYYFRFFLTVRILGLSLEYF